MRKLCRHHADREAKHATNGIPLCCECQEEALEHSADMAAVLELAVMRWWTIPKVYLRKEPGEDGVRLAQAG